MTINKNTVINNTTTKNKMKGEIKMVSVEMKMQEVIAVAKEVGVAYRVGMTKAQLVEEVNAVLSVKEHVPAAGETPVAEEIQKEEIKVKASPEQILKEIQQRNNEEMLNRWAKKTEEVIIKTSSSKRVNQTRESLYKEILNKARKYVEGLGELRIHVVGVRWNLNAHNELVPVGTNKNKYGWMHVLVEPGVLQYHVYNPKIKKFEWRDFSNFDLDAAGINADGSMRNRSRIDIFRPITGSGNLVLPIYHSEALGGFFVMLPNVMAKNGEFRPIFKAGDHRWGTFSVNNNGRVNAALSAYLRMTQSQFIQDNPLNRHGFNESCMNCQHLVYLGVRDGVTDDIHMEDAKSNVILSILSIEQLAQSGQYHPQGYCTVFRKLVDAEAVTELNKALAAERQAVEVVEEIGKNGEVTTSYRYPGAGQVVMNGKIVNISEVRRNHTKATCESCPFYHKVERKSQERINAEIVASREAAGDHRAETFVSKYFTEAPKIERQVVQTKVNGTWVTAFPGEVEGAEDFRIKGLGGIMVYTHPQWAEANKELGALEYVAPIYEYDEKKADFERKLQVIFHAARNLASLTQEEANTSFALAMAKPQGLSEYDSKRWDRAVEWLRQAVIWAQERSAYANRKPFAQKFFVAEDGIHADDIMSETRFREENGLENGLYVNSFAASEKLSFRSLTDKEFVRYLDESTALDLVYYVLTTGQPVYITGEVRSLKEGERQDAELVAGALQHMLDAHVASFLYGVRRAVNPKEALDALKVCDEVKAYIASYIKL